jgi:NAD kinase
MFTPSIIIVTRQTRLQGLRSRWVTDSQAKFRLKQAKAIETERRAIGRKQRGGAATVDSEVAAEADFDEYVAEDRTYQAMLQRLKMDLDFGLPVKLIDRSYLPTFDFFSAAAIVVVGQDGLVANTAKYSKGLPIIGVNPDPERIDGILLPFQVSQTRIAVKKVLDDNFRARSVTLAEVQLNDGQKMLAFNDFFIGCASHVSARYTLEVEGRSEAQSSSGVLVATGAGSTGWLSSVFNMARGITQLMGVPGPDSIQLDWEDRRLAWMVREPFASRHSQANLVAGILPEGQELVVESLMPENGVIFSDGIESDFLPFASGTIARIKASDQRAQLVVK